LVIDTEPGEELTGGIKTVLCRLAQTIPGKALPSACNPGTWKAEARRPHVRDQPGLHSKTINFKKK
jgi:hypothetical protein